MNYRNIFFVLAIAFLFIAAKSDLPSEFTFKNFEKTISKIDSNLYASKFETTNLQYKTFLKELKTEGKIIEYNLANIDSMTWKSKVAYNDPYIEFYHTHIAYNNYPVVNISYDGAKLFCEWMTQKYNEYPKRKFNKVKFRLPTQTEWEKTARAGLKGTIYPWGGMTLTCLKGGFMCNFYPISAECIHYNKETKEYEVMENCYLPFSISDRSDITAPVDMYTANDFGIYNISGNVKEMVQEKGIVRGGGWRSTGYDVRIESVEIYDKSAIDIGFRYFVEIIEE